MMPSADDLDRSVGTSGAVPASSRAVWFALRFEVATAAVAVVAVFQNFFRLASAPLMPNEDLYARMGWEYVHWGAMSAVQRAPVITNFEHPPLAKLMFGLAQVVTGHPGVTASRAVDALFVLATAGLLGWWVGSTVGKWAGLSAGGCLACMPSPIFVDTTRFARTASLDTVCQFFLVAALVFGWRWSRAQGGRAWALAVGTGICLGLATASKENGFLGLLGPLVLSLFWSRTSWARLGTWCAQFLTVIVSSAAVFLACYLPFGNTAGRIRYLMRFQSTHSTNGHLVGLAGQVYIHPPWWANFWFAGHSLGWPLSVCLSAGAFIALLVRRDSIVAWLATAMIGPVLFHCFFAGVALPYYWTLWTPAVIALAAAGWQDLLIRSRRSGNPFASSAGAIIVAAAIAAVAIPSAVETTRVATLHPEGATAVASLRSKLHLHGAVLATGTFRDETDPPLAPAQVIHKVPSQLTAVDMIIVGKPRCRTLRSRAILALVTENLRNGNLQLVHTDRLLTAYVVNRPLTPPTSAQVTAQPNQHLADHC